MSDLPGHPIGAIPPPAGLLASVRQRARARRTRTALAGIGLFLAVVVGGVSASGLVGAQDDPESLVARPEPVAMPSPSTASPLASQTVSPGPVAPAPAPTPAPAAAPLVLATTSATGALELFSVRPGQRDVQRVRRLDAPSPAARVISASLSAGSNPTVCAVWRLDPKPEPTTTDISSSLTCYAPGSPTGVKVDVARAEPVNVAVRADGRAVAWSTFADEANGRIDVASLDGVRINEVRSFLADPTRPEGSGEASFTGRSVGYLAWLGDDELGVSQGNQSDDDSGLTRFDVAPGSSTGWARAPHIRVARSVDSIFDVVVSPPVDGAVLAVDRPYWLLEEDELAKRPAPRAVRVDLRTGQVRDVVAFPAAGREVTSVSGGARGVLYVTQERDSRRDDLRDRQVVVSVRYPDEARGQPLTGLPSDVLAAVLQP